MNDHGHVLLINYIKNIDKNVSGKTIIEVGTVREFLKGQNSTECFIKLCVEKNMKLITIDMDEKCSNNAKMLCEKYNFKNCEIITSKGEDYINTLNTFDFIYLDGYDYDHGHHSEERNMRYNLNLNKKINNEDCWNSHLLICKKLVEISNDNSIICFDDIISDKIGKGVTALPFLLNNKWKITNKTNTSVLLSLKDKQIYVVGNGSSLKDFDFNFLKNKEWIGCTLGFRHWEELGFYPTHYVNVDLVVCEYQLEKIKDMIINNKCKTFLLTSYIIQFWNEILNYKNVYYIEQLKGMNGSPFKLLYDWCSGSSAACYGICMGANIINLLGMDCNYIEFIPECEKQPNGTLKIIKQPINNPNYYYPTYQRVGDLYNVPNTDRIHKKSWKDLNNLSKRINNNVVIKNYNTSDKLDDIFNRFDLNDIKSL